MYLRKIALYVVAFVFLGLIGLHYAVTRIVLVQGLNGIENQFTKEHVNRAASALTQRISNLASISRDWSTREEVIAMLPKQQKSFAGANIDNERLSELNINLMLIINAEGQVVYGKALDLNDMKEIPLPRNLPEDFTNNPILFLDPFKGKRVAGVYMLKEQPMIITARPIIDIVHKSKPLGVLLLGEFLNDRLTTDLSILTQLSINYIPLDITSTATSTDISAVLPLLSEKNPTAVQVLNTNTIAGYKLIDDISGKPALIQRVTTQRGMHVQAQRSIMLYIIAVALAGVLSAAIILILLEKKLLSRIAFIIQNIEHIAASKRVTARLPVEKNHNDELTKLAVSINHMLTALETADKALMESEVKYRRVVEHANDGIVITQDRRLSYVNPRMTAITGYSESELQDAFLDKIIHKDDLTRSYDLYTKAESGEETPDIVELALQHKDGHIVPVEVNIGFIRYLNKPSALVVIRDITERKRAEELLASEKERLSVTLRSIAEGVITTDTQMRIMLMSKVAERLTGWSQEEVYGKNLNEVIKIVREKTKEPCDQPLLKIVSEGVMVELVNQTLMISRDQNEHTIALTGAPIRDHEGSVIGTVLAFRDITEKRRVEEELIKMQRMESVTTLAASIAHDFNNILAGILGNLSLAKDQCGDNENLKTSISEAEKASIRANVLIQQLVTFSKSEVPVKKKTSIPELIRDSAEFALRGSNVSCKYEIAYDLWMTEVDPMQISQVIHNLIVNAKQAMPEGGIITIRAKNCTSDKNAQAGPTQGSYVKISVRDQGVGIPPENLEHIFEPFFTTNSKRIGLGLSTAQSIISKHNGYILVHSEPGKKTIFDVFLPAAHDQNEPLLIQEERIAYGKGSILALEDDKTVRNLLGNALRMLGYDIAFAYDGNEAIKKYKKAMHKGEGFDLVIIDLNIPGGMGGKETIRNLLDYDPNTKAIVSSGNTTDAVLTHYHDYGFLAAIKKPYKVSELSDTIQKVLTNG